MKHIIIILLVIAVITGCEKATKPVDPPNNNEYCPPPMKDRSGYNGSIILPSILHNEQQLSYDGTKLAFVPLPNIIRVLNIKTGEIQSIDVSKLMPSNMFLIGRGVGVPKWSPYDNNRLLFLASTGTDTVGDGKRYKSGLNIFILSLDGKEFKRVTPSIFGQTGAESNFSLIDWLPNSTINNDKILISYVLKGSGFIQTYTPQNYELMNYNFPIPRRTTFDQKKSLNVRFSTYNKAIYSINDYDLNFDETFQIDIEFQASFSPSGRNLAFSVRPDNIDTTIITEDYPDSLYWNARKYERFTEIWIIDVDKVLAERPAIVPVKKINLRKQFCKYSLAGAYPEFLSETTLAVSMHENGGDISYLWEITIDGDIVRQLTFEP